MPLPDCHRTIYLVEDHPMTREGIALTTKERCWEICGQAESSTQALDEIPRLKPDLVTMDISLPGKNGLELIKDLIALLPQLRILVFSMHDESLYAERAMRAGAKGYVMKGESTAVILHAMNEVLSGGFYFSNDVSQRLLNNLAGTRVRSVLGLEQLTDRELDVFELLGRGRSSRQTSTLLNISPKTVDAHRTNIRVKLGIPDAPGLMRAAVLWVEQNKSWEHPSPDISPAEQSEGR